MAKLFDKDGNEVEAFTPEELESKKKEAMDEYLKANPDKSKDLDEATKKVAELQKQIDEGGMSEGQKQRLLDDKKKAEEEKNAVTETLTKEVAELRNAVIGMPKKKALDALSKGDKELRDKLEAKYDSLMKTGEYPQDEEGVLKAVSDAATLVNGSKPAPNFMDGVVGAGDAGAGQRHGTATTETDNSKAMRKTFGITDAEMEKHAPKQETTT